MSAAFLSFPDGWKKKNAVSVQFPLSFPLLKRRCFYCFFNHWERVCINVHNQETERKEEVKRGKTVWGWLGERCLRTAGMSKMGSEGRRIHECWFAFSSWFPSKDFESLKFLFFVLSCTVFITTPLLDWTMWILALFRSYVKNIPMSSPFLGPLLCSKQFRGMRLWSQASWFWLP